MVIYSWFTYEHGWFSIAMLVYQRVNMMLSRKLTYLGSSSRQGRILSQWVQWFWVYTVQFRNELLKLQCSDFFFLLLPSSSCSSCSSSSCSRFLFFLLWWLLLWWWWWLLLLWLLLQAITCTFKLSVAQANPSTSSDHYIFGKQTNIYQSLSSTLWYW